MPVADIAAAAPAAQSTRAFSSLAGNFDTFLTLLTTQLKNQDPLQPLDTEKFTEQLVQFAGVEQSIQTNSYLEALINLQSAADRGAALDYVGKQVTIDGDKSVLTAAGARWAYELPAAAKSVDLSIVNEAGETVARLDGAATAGAHGVVWNGVGDDGAPAAPGVYRLAIDARDANGAALAPSTAATIPVTGVAFLDGKSLLETGLGRIGLEAVRRVEII